MFLFKRFGFMALLAIFTASCNSGSITFKDNSSIQGNDDSVVPVPVPTDEPEPDPLLAAGSDFTAPEWTHSIPNPVITPNAVRNPVDQALDADLIEDNSDTATLYSYQDVSPDRLEHGKDYRCSMYLKPVDTAASSIFIWQTPFGVEVPKTSMRIDWGVNPILGSQGLGLGSHTYGAIHVQDGWYYAWVILTYDSALAETLRCEINPASTNTEVGSVYVWNARLEKLD